MTSSIPGANTWAMMLTGFAGIGFVRSRRLGFSVRRLRAYCRGPPRRLVFALVLFFCGVASALAQGTPLPAQVACTRVYFSGSNVTPNQVQSTYVFTSAAAVAGRYGTSGPETGYAKAFFRGQASLLVSRPWLLCVFAFPLSVGRIWIVGTTMWRLSLALGPLRWSMRASRSRRARSI
jgi:hypothetical protein